MGKYIYKITNKINGLCYIGQSNDPERRFKEHCQRNESYNSLIHQAIIKYGEDNFIFETLGFFEDYNEKEKAFIKEFDCLAPHGYNIQEGGEEPPHYSGEQSSSAKISNETAKAIQRDLLDISVLRKNIRKNIISLKIFYDISMMGALGEMIL